MRYAFATPEWFACLHGVISERASQVAVAHPGTSYSICEVFTDPPQHLRRDGDGTIAWHAIICGADVSFGLTEIAKADFMARADFAAVEPLARYDTRGEPARAAELAALVEILKARGKLEVTGASPNATLFSVHDAIARLTA